MDRLLERVLHEGQHAIGDIAPRHMLAVADYVPSKWVLTLKSRCMDDVRAAQNLLLFLAYSEDYRGQQNIYEMRVSISGPSATFSERDLIVQQLLYQYPTHSGVVYQALHFYWQSQKAHVPAAWRVLDALMKLEEPELSVVSMAFQCLTRADWDRSFATLIAKKAVHVLTWSFFKYSSALIMTENPEFVPAALVVLSNLSRTHPGSLHTNQVVVLIRKCFDEGMLLSDQSVLKALDLLLLLAPRDSEHMETGLPLLLHYAVSPSSKWQPQSLACLLLVVFAAARASHSGPSAFAHHGRGVNRVLDVLNFKTISLPGPLAVPVNFFPALVESIDFGMVTGNEDVVRNALSVLSAVTSTRTCRINLDPSPTLWRVLRGGYCRHLSTGSHFLDILNVTMPEVTSPLDVVALVNALVTSILDGGSEPFRDSVPTLEDFLVECVIGMARLVKAVPSDRCLFYLEDWADFVRVLCSYECARANQWVMNALLALGSVIETRSSTELGVEHVQGVRRRIFLDLKPVIFDFPQLVSGMVYLTAYEASVHLKDPECRRSGMVPHALKNITISHDPEFQKAAVDFLVEFIREAGMEETNMSPDVLNFLQTQVIPLFVVSDGVASRESSCILPDFNTYVSLLPLVKMFLVNTRRRDVDMRTLVCLLASVAEEPPCVALPGSETKFCDFLMFLGEDKTRPPLCTYSLLSEVQALTLRTCMGSQALVVENGIAYVLPRVNTVSSILTTDEIISLLSYIPLFYGFPLLHRKCAMLVQLARGKIEEREGEVEREADRRLWCVNQAVDNRDRFERRLPWLWLSVSLSHQKIVHK